MNVNKRFEIIIKDLYNNNQSSFAKAVGVTPTVIANVVGARKGKPSFDVLEKICANANISPQWLLTGEGSMLAHSKDNTLAEQPHISQNIEEGIPYYDVDFIGGFDEIINNQNSIPSCNVVVPGFEKALLWCNVTGHSMEPKINHGDIVALSECSIDDIQYGETYAVVLDTLRTIKIIRKGSKPDTLRYVPINVQNFDEQEFPLSRILHVYKVVGSISKFF